MLIFNFIFLQKFSKSYIVFICCNKLTLCFNMRLLYDIIFFHDYDFIFQKDRLSIYFETHCMHAIRHIFKFDKFITSFQSGMNNKLWKIQQMLNNFRCVSLNTPRDQGKFSINVQMIPFLGHAVAKQY